jgi:hypothetical protein
MKNTPVTPPQIETRIGIGWYKPDQWKRLLEISSDRKELHPTFEAWLSEAEQSLRLYRKLGVPVETLEVDVEQMLEWLHKHNMKVNGATRARYIQWLLETRHPPAQP